MSATRIYIDSANLTEIKRAITTGFVTGVTTNPKLMRPETGDPLAHLAAIISEFDAIDIYYQPTGYRDDDLDEAEEAASLAPERVVLKLPATPTGITLAADLRQRGLRVCLTAAQYPEAMILAEAVGCEAIIPYVDRATRDPAAPTQLIAALARVRRGSTQILAASIKSRGQLTEAIGDGADAVSAPLTVLLELAHHPSSEAAEADFALQFAERP